jgi:glycosyltransferase involved in cell wall biosynthesis
MLQQSEAWFVSDRAIEFVQHGVTVRCFRSFDEMAASARATDILWVRGKCKAYLSVLRRMRARLRVYYPASKRFLNQDWTHFDVLLVDDDRQIAPVTRLGGATFVRRVIKTADPNIFRPLAGIEKRYDLCMIGAMNLTRKNHNALVRLLVADPSLSAVVIGKQDPEIVAALRATGARLELIDFCGREDLNRFINQSRIGFVPSLMDAAPRVILEFMAAGVPVLMNSAILGGREYIIPETGLLVPESEFVQATQRMRSGRMPFDPRRGFEENFAPEKAARHFGGIVTQALQRLGRSSPIPAPGRLRQIISRPLFLRNRLARCWREIAFPVSTAEANPHSVPTDPDVT